MRMPKLSEGEIENGLRDLSGWSRIGESITKIYVFVDFAQAITFVNHVAAKAEAADHHPDIDIRYQRVILTVSTHDAGGITQNDLTLAAAADQAAKALETT